MATTKTRTTHTKRAVTPRRRKRKLSKAGIRLIAGFEGFRSDLYDDAAGHCTIGYGHLVHQGSCDGSESAEFRRGVTRERGLEILGEDAASAAAAVNEAVTVPLEQDQFDALTSFVFNIGSGAFRESTLLKLLNRGKYDEVPEQLNRWVKAGSRTLEGLVRRREAEGQLFARGTVRPADDGTMTTREVQRALKELGWPRQSRTSSAASPSRSSSWTGMQVRRRSRRSSPPSSKAGSARRTSPSRSSSRAGTAGSR